MSSLGLKSRIVLIANRLSESYWLSFFLSLVMGTQIQRKGGDKFGASDGESLEKRRLLLDLWAAEFSGSETEGNKWSGLLVRLGVWSGEMVHWFFHEQVVGGRAGR